MAQYKVPQDVEAEDKLIGPFSFRQFIYLGIAAFGIAISVGLWQIFPGLIVIPLPFIALFLTLGFPLRKDQPMETYLTAVIRFYLKPRKRLWQPEGSIGLVTIVAPRVPEAQLTKSVGGVAAAEQLQYLAQVVDTQGWATRGVVSPTVSMNDTVYAEAQEAEDILDENTHVSQTFGSMIDETSDKYKQSVAEQFRQAVQQPVAQTTSTQATAHSSQQSQSAPRDDHGQGSADPAASPHLDFNPYPSSMHQHVLKPLDPKRNNQSQGYSHQSGTQPSDDTATSTDAETPTPSNSLQSTSPEAISPDIMRLANNNDLSISALANEAHRIENRDNEEVVINLH